MIILYGRWDDGSINESLGGCLLQQALKVDCAAVL